MRKEIYGESGTFLNAVSRVAPFVSITSAFFGTLALESAIFSNTVIASSKFASVGAFCSGLVVAASAAMSTDEFLKKIKQKIADKNQKEKIEKLSKKDDLLLINVSNFSRKENTWWNEYNGHIDLITSLDDYKIRMSIMTYVYPVKEFNFYNDENKILQMEADNVKAFLFLESSDEKCIEPLAEISYDWDKKRFPKEQFMQMLSAVENGDINAIEEYRQSPNKPNYVPSYSVNMSGRKIVKNIEENIVSVIEKKQSSINNPFDLTPDFKENEISKKR